LADDVKSHRFYVTRAAAAALDAHIPSAPLGSFFGDSSIISQYFSGHGLLHKEIFDEVFLSLLLNI
jgi:hypothetical protein